MIMTRAEFEEAWDGRIVLITRRASLGDLDGNGHLDIYVSNVHHKLQAEGSLLWMNGGGQGASAWTDEAARRNALNEKRFGWGAAIGDLDRGLHVGHQHRQPVALDRPAGNRAAAGPACFA